MVVRFSVIYISGIMFYKLGIEFFNGSIVTLASKMFDTKGIVSEGFASEAPDTSIAKPFTKRTSSCFFNFPVSC